MNLLIELPLVSQYWDDQGSNLFANGDFEGGAGPPPASWSQFNCLFTRQSGSRGISGSYVGRVGYDGVNAIGFGYQGACVAGRRYHGTSWMKTDGVAIPRLSNGAGVDYWIGAASVAWQGADVIIPSAAVANLGILSANLAAGRYVDADDMTLYEQFMYTRNRGLLGQTPATSRVQVGDGRTAATFPTMLNLTQTPRKGMAFNGSQYAQWMNPLASGTYTFCALVMRTTPGAFTGYLIDARGGGGTGYVYWDGAALASSSGTIYVNDTATTALPYGQLCFVACAGIAMTAPVNVVFAAHNTYVGPWYGNIFGAGLYPGTASARQLRDIRQRMLAEVWT